MSQDGEPQPTLSSPGICYWYRQKPSLSVTLQPIFPQLPQVLCSAKWTRCRGIYQKREQNVDLTKGQVTDGQRSCI